MLDLDHHQLSSSTLILAIFSFFFFSLHGNAKQIYVDSYDVLSSCLIENNVHNFTFYPRNDNDSSPYFGLLNFSMQNLRLANTSSPKPEAIILPGTKQELASSVLCCRKTSLDIRVRCGGHSYEGTSFLVAGPTSFVIIDMMNLDQVRVDLESEVAWVEGGATLGQTYYEIAEASGGARGFSAGSCPTVGSSGHIAGGGFGLMSRKYGLAADNIVDAILIDAEGRILDKDEMGEDVFWAIRGGGGGIWGIVYAWKIRLLSVPRTVTSFIVSRPGTRSQVASLVHKWQFVAPKLDDKFYLSSTLGAGLPEMGGNIGLSATFKGFYLGPKQEAFKIINSTFPKLGLVPKECVEMSWIESILFFGDLEKGASVERLKDRYYKTKTYFKAKSDYVRTPIPFRGMLAALDVLEKEPKGLVILDPYGGAMEKINDKSIPFPHRRGNLYTIQYLVNWDESNANQGRNFVDWIRGFYDSMTPYVSRGPRAAYVNYMDFDLGIMDGSKVNDIELARVWGEKYFLHNYDRLVSAKTIIDPLNVFRHQQGIPPLAEIASEVVLNDFMNA
ncbi:reticuline oxidase-like [Impatiens glandulifera]|uniref:reticuline oxidase-like n=1 Tax=Impatiens glandulifera TaxID=253017 RepID=UPI001FB06376|nr:reticuline oxidase-like [Impatiens glandulifera]